MLNASQIEKLLKEEFTEEFTEVGEVNFTIYPERILYMIEEEVSQIEEEGYYTIEEQFVFDDVCYTIDFGIELSIIENEFTDDDKEIELLDVDIIDVKPYTAKENGFL